MKQPLSEGVCPLFLSPPKHNPDHVGLMDSLSVYKTNMTPYIPHPPTAATDDLSNPPPRPSLQADFPELRSLQQSSSASYTSAEIPADPTGERPAPDGGHFTETM